MNINKHTVTDIATALALTERRVQQLVKEGILPTPLAGKYDLSAAIKSYGRYLTEKQINRSSNINELAAEKLRLLKAQVEKAELELDVLKGKYLEAEWVEFTWSD